MYNEIGNGINPSSEEAERWKAIKMGGWRYENGSHYIGEWSQLGHKQGTGYLRFSDGSRYGGQFLDGLSHGLGCLWFADGSKYEGQFMNGWFHGSGVFWRSDGMRYEGEFRGGRIWGHGLITYKDLSHGFPRNEGYFQDCRLIRQQRSTEAVHRAQKCALMARAQCDHENYID